MLKIILFQLLCNGSIYIIICNGMKRSVQLTAAVKFLANMVESASHQPIQLFASVH